ncbi:ligase-associated DNA damage response endonuclease PdeM [Roseovarius dicentrarchi]|uniref:ligase-associated DNA damage response endonuclease PdeM n=1 Tax=Roseovarius dicentrarchi TaxID=2250573 RepID=UPI000DEAA125|nr:ligase-associated DNA damage response endonuclease PdeM [Roseovarius dicentrarchi]
MTGHPFTLHDAHLVALATGALYWPDKNLLCVSDLHLGKSERRARLGTGALPPYETHDTLSRLEADLHSTDAKTIICLGDSFDDSAAVHALSRADKLRITALQAGRRWIWIEGNHDPGPIDLGGTHLGELSLAPLTFRHIAQPAARGEVSGHYHPKASVRTRARSVSRPAFLIDGDRIILPAYGTYTGGLRSNDSTLAALMSAGAIAVLTGPKTHAIPMPR